ncbi:MAG: hypothetical protein ACI9LF_000816, partial [Flavobacteriales bacterium]
SNSILLAIATLFLLRSETLFGNLFISFMTINIVKP